jgi:RimJ/RimL family protein N-acetyltransferase
MKYDFREMELAETESMIDYFLNADADFLIGMGADKEKMPSATEWFDLLAEDFARPIEHKQFYYLVWQANGISIGHCNINKIKFGRSAFMHLHIWESENRKSGCASNLLSPSIRHFFERFELQELFCEPFSDNPAPNNALPKAGFRFLKTYETTPGWINFHQPVNRWVIDREKAMRTSPIELDEESECTLD